MTARTRLTMTAGALILHTNRHLLLVTCSDVCSSSPGRLSKTTCTQRQARRHIGLCPAPYRAGLQMDIKSRLAAAGTMPQADTTGTEAGETSKACHMRSWTSEHIFAFALMPASGV